MSTLMLARWRCKDRETHLRHRQHPATRLPDTLPSRWMLSYLFKHLHFLLKQSCGVWYFVEQRVRQFKAHLTRGALDKPRASNGGGEEAAEEAEADWKSGN